MGHFSFCFVLLYPLGRAGSEKVSLFKGVLLYKRHIFLKCVITLWHHSPEQNRKRRKEMCQLCPLKTLLTSAMYMTVYVYNYCLNFEVDQLGP